MAWKNGKGRTLELAIEPAGADLESFDWRVSTATIGASGPFSRFAGCERVILLVEGEGFALGERIVDRRLEPVHFDGEAEIECRLLGGAVRDFNVITRRSRVHAEVTVGRGEHEAVGPTTLVYVVSGRAEVDGVAVEPGELARVSGPARLRGEAYIVVRFRPPPPKDLISRE